jgi:serine protease AprX
VCYSAFEPLRAAMESLGSQVDRCWLTSAMRATGPARSCADIASDAAVRLLDVPRPIESELTVAGVTCGAPAFRQRFSASGRGVRVALIDREASLQHPALNGRISFGGNFTRDAPGNPVLHATAIAGVIAADSAELQGIAPQATLLNYKILPSGDDFDAALAIEQALSDDANVANCSWGTGAAVDGTSRETRAVNAAWNLGLIMVKSAGNGGPRRNTMTAPADAEGVIVVAACDRAGLAAQDYSSRGPTNNGKHPTLCAPGGSREDALVSCLADVSSGPFGPIPPGTSMATGFVTGAAALLLERNPNATPDAIRALLIAACRPFPDNDPNIHGAGMLDLRMILA